MFSANGLPPYFRLHPRSLISAFVVRRYLDSIIAILSKSGISRLKRADLRVSWSDAPKTDFLMTWPIFKSIRSRHDWISKGVSVKHNSNALKWGHELFCAVALCLFVLQWKNDSDMLVHVYVLWLFWPLRVFWLICLPLQFRYKIGRRMKNRKKATIGRSKTQFSVNASTVSCVFAARWSQNNHSFCM